MTGSDQLFNHMNLSYSIKLILDDSTALWECGLSDKLLYFWNVQLCQNLQQLSFNAIKF